MDLAVDQQGIDYFTAIINCYIPQELCLAGFFVDLHDADVRAKRKGEILWLEKVSRRQARLSVWRKFFRDVGRQSNFLNGQTRSPITLWLRESARRRFPNGYYRLRLGRQGVTRR